MAINLDGTSGVTFPSWTTATRPSTPSVGQSGFNTDLGVMETYNGTAWTNSDLPAADTSGNLLQSNGTTWTSAAQSTVTAGNVSGTVAVANGGTGQTTYTNGQLLIGNTTGNTLTKATITAGTGISVTNGPGSITIANTAVGGQLQTQLFTAPGTWTNPGSVTQARVTVIGAGGQGQAPGSGAPGGVVVAMVPVSSPVAVTVGAGLASGPTSAATGGSSSFGTLATATGGSASAGTGSTTGTALVINNVGLGNPGTGSGAITFGSITGTNARSGSWPGPAVAYTASGGVMAGVGANYLAPLGQNASSYSGLVLVEWVG